MQTIGQESFELPLLHDHHSHPLLYASLGAAVNLESTCEKPAAIERLRTAEQSHEGDLLLAFGWRSNQFSWSFEELESFPAIAIFNLSLHELKVNQAGREQLRRRYGDDVDRIEDQIWYENNFRRVLNWFANLNANVENLKAFYAQLETLGIGSAEELLLVDEREIELFREAELSDRTKFWADPVVFDALSVDAKAEVAGMKLFTDGALGARTAALKEAYLDDAGNHGMLVYSDSELRATVEACLTRKPALAVHAIGDRAIEQIVDTLASVSRKFSTDQVRIEHAQMIDVATARRAKALGVTLSMQPNFSNDSIHYADRMSPRYCLLNNPFRMLIDEVGFEPGKDLIFGSDGMPHGVDNPLEQCLQSGLPHQRTTLDEFVKAYGG